MTVPTTIEKVDGRSETATTTTLPIDEYSENGVTTKVSSIATVMDHQEETATVLTSHSSISLSPSHDVYGTCNSGVVAQQQQKRIINTANATATTNTNSNQRVDFNISDDEDPVVHQSITTTTTNNITSNTSSEEFHDCYDDGGDKSSLKPRLMQRLSTINSGIVKDGGDISPLQMVYGGSGSDDNESDDNNRNIGNSTTGTTTAKTTLLTPENIVTTTSTTTNDVSSSSSSLPSNNNEPTKLLLPHMIRSSLSSTVELDSDEITTSSMAAVSPQDDDDDKDDDNTSSDDGYNDKVQRQRQGQEERKSLVVEKEKLATRNANIKEQQQQQQQEQQQQQTPKQENKSSSLLSSPTTRTTKSEPPQTIYYNNNYGFNNNRIEQMYMSTRWLRFISDFISRNSRVNTKRFLNFRRNSSTISNASGTSCVTTEDDDLLLNNEDNYNNTNKTTDATWIGFWALLFVTCANYMLTPMRDAIALAVGVKHMPALTLASTGLAIVSSVPIGWLFEAPDPKRRKLWKRLGLTRGETQGTSLALFYRCFGISLLSYSIGFQIRNYFVSGGDHQDEDTATSNDGFIMTIINLIVGSSLGQILYVGFFLVVHLMKLHSLSLIWGVTTEAMEYEESAKARQRHLYNIVSNNNNIGGGAAAGVGSGGSNKKSRLQKLAFVGFGGTLGGILGSIIASTAAHVLQISGLLVVAVLLLEISAELSIELGRIMQKHWEDEQRYYNSGGSYFSSSNDLQTLLPNNNAGGDGDNNKNNGTANHISKSTSAASLNSHDSNIVDSSMKRTSSLGCMKRVSSGNSLSSMKRVSSGNSLNRQQRSASVQARLSDLAQQQQQTEKQRQQQNNQINNNPNNMTVEEQINDNSFTQRLLRGITTILRSRLLMAIFTYNALYASTTVLLSFQRAELVANRNNNSNNSDGSTNPADDTAFLAKINMASSTAVFLLQASGAGALIAHRFGSRGTLSLIPIIRLMGVLALAYWHTKSNGQPPNLMVFLILDECTRVINFAVAKPVRESLWRGLSNEARYEAKPIVDTLANRWGSGSAAFLVSLINKAAILYGSTISASSSSVVLDENDDGTTKITIFGFSPNLLLCTIVAIWWACVSADLGQIRRRIDIELKKHQ